jgi:hypothetical protein
MKKDFEIIYKDETGIEVIGTFSSETSIDGHTMEEALEICNIDMDTILIV